MHTRKIARVVQQSHDTRGSGAGGDGAQNFVGGATQFFSRRKRRNDRIRNKVAYYFRGSPHATSQDLRNHCKSGVAFPQKQKTFRSI